MAHGNGMGSNGNGCQVCDGSHNGCGANVNQKHGMMSQGENGASCSDGDRTKELLEKLDNVAEKMISGRSNRDTQSSDGNHVVLTSQNFD
eukprot:5051395-Karenia_brevis.AAC.1